MWNSKSCELLSSCCVISKTIRACLVKKNGHSMRESSGNTDIIETMSISASLSRTFFVLKNSGPMYSLKNFKIRYHNTVNTIHTFSDIQTDVTCTINSTFVSLPTTLTSISKLLSSSPPHRPFRLWTTLPPPILCSSSSLSVSGTLSLFGFFFIASIEQVIIIYDRFCQSLLVFSYYWFQPGV